MNQPTVVNRQDYRAPDYWIDAVDLVFDLQDSFTAVRARIKCRRNGSAAGDAPLVLDGEELELRAIWLDGNELDQDRYQVEGDRLRISGLPPTFELQTLVHIRPDENTSLSGLYRTSGNYCTQCEAMGFRRITYFLDRPDVMATYTVTITGDKTSCPVMLSNGNRTESTELEGDRHRVVWHDPFPKPSYLFALVAGDLRCHPGTFTTRSGRLVQLEIWVEPQNIESCEHALRSLQESMKWDEEVYGLEYDLDIYMIVAVNDFNMGAMENKGLNVFNSKYVLARPDTATDDDYEAVQGVIAHEYFHNWTGNRVTCRDWFQLTLKEGLTVFRDQQFTADMTSAAVKRIADVRALRGRQFAEDCGPMAHPIRPESYISMDNFYTATVYNKGAEIIRMYHTLLGADGFRRAMDLYFERHDGQAVTCDDFRSAMAAANDADFEQFGRWYSQAGTPELHVEEAWDEAAGDYCLKFRQSYPDIAYDVPGTEDRRPVVIPVALGLLDQDGSDLPLRLQGESQPGGTTRVLELKREEETFTFAGLSHRPTPSLLRGYSAPVKLRGTKTREQLAFLMAHDSDAFNRWDAGQTLATELLLELAARAAVGEALQLDPLFSHAFAETVSDEGLDGSLKSLAMSLPSEEMLSMEMDDVDPDAVFTARQFVRHELAQQHRQLLEAAYCANSAASYQNDQASIHRRRFKNACLSYLSVLEEDETTEMVASQFEKSNNMSDSQSGLAMLSNLDCPQRQQALDAFYQRWQNDPLVLDKWFGLQALSRLPDTVERVKELTTHVDFSLQNPNRVRALIAAFCMNQVRFHDISGRGYHLLADTVIELDPRNPQVAARLVSMFNQWRRFEPGRRELIQTELKRIAEQDSLSKDVFEIVSRALG